MLNSIWIARIWDKKKSVSLCKKKICDFPLFFFLLKPPPTLMQYKCPLKSVKGWIASSVRRKTKPDPTAPEALGVWLQLKSTKDLSLQPSPRHRSSLILFLVLSKEWFVPTSNMLRLRVLMWTLLAVDRRLLRWLICASLLCFSARRRNRDESLYGT